jgi:coatomer subunit beta
VSLCQGMSQLELEDEVQTDLKRATGEMSKDGDTDRNLNRVLQLTGFSDPVYAEAYVTVHQYDIVLDVTVVNRTTETLQNLCLELATMGDLKLVERPQNYALAPQTSKQIKANIKVSSTETGVIFGNIVYETTSALDRNVVLNDIHIDIMDYISPASCADVVFRNMWAEFEWENKVILHSTTFFQQLLYVGNTTLLVVRSVSRQRAKAGSEGQDQRKSETRLFLMSYGGCLTSLFGPIYQLTC